MTRLPAGLLTLTHRCAAPASCRTDTGPARRHDARRDPGRSARSDSGQGSIFIIGFVALAFVLTAFFVDISRALNAHGASLETASQAARAAADQVTQESLRTGDPTRLRIDPAAARAAGRAWLSHAGATGTVTVDATDTSVTVTARVPCRATLLEAFGYRDLSQPATASATLLVGAAGGGPAQPIANLDGPPPGTVFRAAAASQEALG